MMRLLSKAMKSINDEMPKCFMVEVIDSCIEEIMDSLFIEDSLGKAFVCESPFGEEIHEVISASKTINAYGKLKA